MGQYIPRDYGYTGEFSELSQSIVSLIPCMPVLPEVFVIVLRKRWCWTPAVFNFGENLRVFQSGQCPALFFRDELRH